jgi:hypothetical protein
LMLRDTDTKDILVLVGQVDDSDNSSQALDAFMNSKVFADSALIKDIRRRLQTALTLNNRYTLILYWLLRHKGAMDFDYRKNYLNITGKAVRISERCRPSKQHIVPYSYLKDIYPILNRKGRLAKHEANDIGNLTYISAEENGWKCLGNKPLNLREEPCSNRESHFLKGAKIRQFFKVVCDRDAASKERKHCYEQFLRERRAAIRVAFEDFERDLRKRAEITMKTLINLDPAPRLIHKDKAERIRNLPYPPAAKSAIAEMMRLSGKRSEGFNDETEKDLSVSFTVSAAGGKGKAGRILKMTFHESEIRIKAKDSKIVASIRKKFPRLKILTKQGGWSSLNLLVKESEAAETLKLLHNKIKRK